MCNYNHFSRGNVDCLQYHDVLTSLLTYFSSNLDVHTYSAKCVSSPAPISRIRFAFGFTLYVFAGYKGVEKVSAYCSASNGDAFGHRNNCEGNDEVEANNFVLIWRDDSFFDRFSHSNISHKCRRSSNDGNEGGIVPYFFWGVAGTFHHPSNTLCIPDVERSFCLNRSKWTIRPFKANCAANAFDSQVFCEWMSLIWSTTHSYSSSSSSLLISSICTVIASWILFPETESSISFPLLGQRIREVCYSGSSDYTHRERSKFRQWIKDYNNREHKDPVPRYDAMVFN